MTYPSIHARLATLQVTVTPELLGTIFIHLSIFDLLRVERVCKQWRDCVRDVRAIQPALYKCALAVEPGDNPHFKPLDEATANLTYRSLPFGEQLNDTGHSLEQGARSLLKPDTAVEKTFGKKGGAFRLYDLHRRIFTPAVLHRLSTPDAASTFMSNIGDVHCVKCGTFHLGFRWQNLHPLLRFLEYIPNLCIGGSNAIITIRLGYHGTLYQEAEPLYKVFQNAIDLAEHVEVVKSMCADYQLTHDVGIQPAGFLLSVAPEFTYILHSWGKLRQSGLLIGDFLEGLMWCSHATAIKAQAGIQHEVAMLQGKISWGLELNQTEQNALADLQAKITAMEQRMAAMEAYSALWRQQARGGDEMTGWVEETFSYVG